MYKRGGYEKYCWDTRGERLGHMMLLPAMRKLTPRRGRVLPLLLLPLPLLLLLLLTPRGGRVGLLLADDPRMCVRDLVLTARLGVIDSGE